MRKETNMTNLREIEIQLAVLRRKAAKRRDVAGFAANVSVVEAAIATLEARRVEAALAARAGGGETGS